MGVLCLQGALIEWMEGTAQRLTCESDAGEG
jgi:hypothetical protein